MSAHVLRLALQVEALQFRPLILVPVVMSLIAAITAGCGGGGNSSGAGSIILRSQAQVLGSGDDRRITASTENTVTVTGDASALVPGTVLVSGQGSGLLRTVASAAPAGSSTILQTTPATLEDVFASVDLDKHVAVGSAQVADFIPAGPGITLGPNGHATMRPNPRLGGDIELTLDKFTLEDSGAGKLTASGSISLALDLELGYHFNGGDPTVKVILTLDGSAEAKLDAIIQKTFTSKKVKLGTIIGEPLTIFAGIVPIVIVPEFDLYTVLDGTVKVGASLTSSMHLKAILGGVYEHGEAHVVSGLERSASLIPTPNFYGSVNFGFSPIHTECSLSIYGVAGPQITVDAPRFDLTYEQDLNPAGKRITAGATFQGAVGLKMAVFGDTILDHEFPGALSVHLNLFDRFFPDTSGVVVGVH